MPAAKGSLKPLMLHHAGEVTKSLDVRTGEKDRFFFLNVRKIFNAADARDRCFDTLQGISACFGRTRAVAACSNNLSSAINISRDYVRPFTREADESARSRGLCSWHAVRLSSRGRRVARRRLLQRRRWRIFQCQSWKPRRGRSPYNFLDMNVLIFSHAG